MSGVPRPDSVTTKFLASVTTAAEARVAVAGGADIIDCKDPLTGALGALPVQTVRCIRDAVGEACPVSATIGDLAGPVEAVADAARAMAATDIDYVKVGFFPQGNAQATIAALGAAFPSPVRRGARGRLSVTNGVIVAAGPAVAHASSAAAASHTAPRLIGLLFADQEPDFGLIDAMARAGFAGVMLDTAEKTAGSLPQVIPRFRLSLFVREARRCGLMAGLAGALRLPHIGVLTPLAPDVLGFRGALCRDADRTSALDARAVAAVRQAIDDQMGCKLRGLRKEALRV